MRDKFLELESLDFTTNPYYKDNPEFFLTLKQLIHDHRRDYFRYYLQKKDYVDLVCWMNKIVPDVAKSHNLMSKSYWIMFGLIQQPKCLLCEKPFEGSVFRFRLGYPVCCRQCNNKKNSPRTLHARETNFIRFGSYTNMGTELFKKQAKEGFLRHYGTTNNMKSEIGKAEYRNALLQKFGVINISQLPRIQSKAKQKYVYDNLLFDSGPEVAFYICLADHGIRFEYQPKRFIPYIVDGITHHYCPDFYLFDEFEGRKGFVEIKGDHFFKEDGTMQNPFDHTKDYLAESKHQCMLKNGVHILRSYQYSKYVEYVSKKYGTSYICSLKQKVNKQ